MTIPIRLLLKELGLRSLSNYALYRVLLRSGYLQAKTPVYEWADRSSADWRAKKSVALEPVFFFSGGEFTDRLTDSQREALRPVSQQADEILRGDFRLFGGKPIRMGFPPDWLLANQVKLPADRHWSTYSTEGEADLRTLWELSRFGWAYVLARAYRATGDHRYVEGFFSLVDSWCATNPPNRGPNWISAQEVALRIMALSFAWHAFRERFERTSDRVDQLMTLINAHAERIPPTLRYARAQRNNHLLTEAVGLYTAGLLFPSLRSAPRWKRLGWRWLNFALLDQVFEDGGYIQHSANYHRLALSAGTWAAQLGNLNGEPLPADSLSRLADTTSALLALVDAENGRAPNFGNNDGSDILPLASTPHVDYRPVLQAAALAFLGRPAFPPGPWDETSYWLGLREPPSLELHAGHQAVSTGNTAQSDPKSAARVDFPQAGLHLVKGEDSWAMLRRAHFRSRPGHSDQLNLDLWWAGHNIARDRGTYRYTDGRLSEAAMHNALVVDRIEPMRRAGRFLWLSRADAQILGRWSSEDEVIEVLSAEHPLPAKTVHRRSVVRVGDAMWVIMDELGGAGTHEIRLNWTLPDWPWKLDGAQLSLEGEPGRLRLSVDPSGADLALYRERQLVAGTKLDIDPAGLGWWCPTYSVVEPALSLVVQLRGELPLRLSSWWRLGELEPEHLGLAWDSLEQGPLSLFASESGDD